MILFTLDQCKILKREAVTRLLNTAGSIPHLARMLDIEQSVVRGWIRRGAVSEDKAPLIHTHPTLGPMYPFARLRPDLGILSASDRAYCRDILRQHVVNNSEESSGESC